MTANNISIAKGKLNVDVETVVLFFYLTQGDMQNPNYPICNVNKKLTLIYFFFHGCHVR